MFNQLQRWPLAALALAVTSGWPNAAHACATCGCSLSTDAAMGFPTGIGWRVNFEYDYINQDELRSGTRTATPAAVVNSPSNTALGGGEIENSTLNRYFTFGVGYSPNPDWQFDLRLPYVERGHTTFGVQTAPYTATETAPDQLSGARVSALGDAKLIVSYQGLLATSDLGLQLGLKLPTGSYGTKVNFNTGPAAGTPLDASLQAGTGSTDLILGAFYHRPVSRDFDAFANVQYQVAVANKQDQPGNDFRPGNNSTVGLGLRYEANPRFVPQLQLNVFHKDADQGALADTTDTAGTVAYLSPGLTLRAQDKLHLFGFVQLPLLSNLSGYQLAPRWTASVGLSLSL